MIHTSFVRENTDKRSKYAEIRSGDGTTCSGAGRRFETAFGGENGMRAKRFLTVFLAMCLLTVSLAVLPTQAKESPARQIALVYDDSGSMIFNDADEYQENWYRAKYAMEVFAAMMGEKDTMTVFPMSFYRTSVEGSSAPITLRSEQTAEERVKTWHEMNHDYGG